MALPPAAAARLAALVDAYGLPADAARVFSVLLVLQRDDATASTTVRDPVEAVDRHIADSLASLRLPGITAARRVADLGPGAGWPGLALAAALPGARVALVEAAARHCRYLEKAVGAAALRNVEVVHARAEAWPEGIGVHDLVTVRALAALPVVCEYAAPLLLPGGALVAWKGAVSGREEADGLAAADQVGLERVEVRRVVPFPGARNHTLHVFHKIAPTPARFPRRPGMATKRPLSATR